MRQDDVPVLSDRLGEVVNLYGASYACLPFPLDQWFSNLGITTPQSEKHCLGHFKVWGGEIASTQLLQSYRYRAEIRAGGDLPVLAPALL